MAYTGIRGASGGGYGAFKSGARAGAQPSRRRTAPGARDAKVQNQPRSRSLAFKTSTRPVTVQAEGGMDAVEFILQFWRDALQETFHSAIVLKELELLYLDADLEANGLHRGSWLTKGARLDLRMPIDVQIMLPEVEVTASLRPPLFKDTIGEFRGWVHREAKAYATPDREMPIFEVPPDTKLDILAVHRDPKDTWAFVTARAPSDLAGSYFFVDLASGIFLADRRGRNMRGASAAEIEHAADRWKLIETDPNCSLIFVEGGKTIDGILRSYYHALVKHDNLFMARDTVRFRVVGLANHIWRNNRAAFPTGQLKSLQASTHLKLNSVEYLREHQSEYLSGLNETFYSESDLEHLYKSIELFEQAMQISQPNVPTTAGIIGGLLNGVYQNLAEMVMDAIDTMSNIGKAIQFFLTKSMEEIAEIVKKLDANVLKQATDAILDGLKDYYGGLITDFWAAMNHPTLFEKFFAFGSLIGYVVFEILKAIYSGTVTLWLKGVLKAAPVLGKLAARIFDMVDKVNDTFSAGIAAAAPGLDLSKAIKTKRTNTPESVEKALVKKKKGADLGDDLPPPKLDSAAQRMNKQKVVDFLNTKRKKGQRKVRLKHIKNFQTAVMTSTGLRVTFRKKRTEFYVELDHDLHVTHAHFSVREFDPDGPGYSPKATSSNRQYTKGKGVTFEDGTKSDAGHVLAQQFMKETAHIVRFPQHLFQNRVGGKTNEGTWRWLEERIVAKLEATNGLTSGNKGLMHSVQHKVEFSWKDGPPKLVEKIIIKLAHVDQNGGTRWIKDIPMGLGKDDRIPPLKIEEIKAVFP